MARRSEHDHDELRQMVLDAARKTVDEAGLSALSARGLATAVGYSVGTLYNLFDNLDHIVLTLNGATLQALHTRLTEVQMAAKADKVEPIVAITRLAGAYIEFASASPHLWQAMFSHRLPPGMAMPPAYDALIADVFRLVESVLAPLFTKGAEAECSRSARILWAGIHGMLALNADGKLNLIGGDLHGLARDLIHRYLAGLDADMAKAA